MLSVATSVTIQHMSNIHPISHVHVEHMGPPPSKMPRLGVEDTVYQRQQQLRHLELLCRLYPEQKRGVLELILKGCNNDVVQAIECILPSHENNIFFFCLQTEYYSAAYQKKEPIVIFNVEYLNTVSKTKEISFF